MTLQPAAFAERAIPERRRLAAVDPSGELEAVAPVPGTAAAWDRELAKPLPTEEMVAEIRRLERERTLAVAIGQELDLFVAEASGPVQWFGPIVENGLDAFQGAPESFKTIGALQLGLAGAAGGSWLGLELGLPRPFVYVAGEKSRATVRDRLERMTTRLRPVAPVRIVHRAGVTFGDRAGWDRVVELVATYGPRTFVVCDTIASLAGPGFDENSGRDMAVALAALRRLGDAGATVAAVHHPNKHGDGTGGVRLRGHSSLWGEVDGVLEFTRPDRSVDAGIVRIEPKDGDLRLIHFRWDRDSFLLDAQGGVLPASTTAIAGVVEALYSGDALTAERIRAEFPGHGRTVMLAKLAEAADAGLIARVGRGKATGYVPVPKVLRSADDSLFAPDGRNADEPSQTRTIELSDPGRNADEGMNGRIVRGRGSIGPPPDESDSRTHSEVVDDYPGSAWDLEA